MKKITTTFLFILISVYAAAQTGEDIFSSGTANFQEGRYSQALSEFRQLLLDPQYASLRGDAYFWIAKVLVAQNRLSDAERNLEFFLANFPDNKNAAEGMYLRGRILFLNAEYEASVLSFAQFIEEHPTSPFIANAYYWTGEALFNLGQLDEAEKMFNAVIAEFPTSFRVEAARYRTSVISMSRREQELLRLLQWTQEESIRTFEDFRRQQEAYEEAILSYQEKLAEGADPEYQEEIQSLLEQIQDLEEKNQALSLQLDSQSNLIRSLENQIRTMENEVKTGFTAASPELRISSDDPDLQLRLDLLALKEDSLDIKSELIQELEMLVRQFEDQQ